MTAITLKKVLDTLTDTTEYDGQTLSSDQKNSAIAIFVRCRGIAFVLTPKVEEQLKAAGANTGLLAEIKKSWSKMTNPSDSLIAIGDDYSRALDFEAAIASYNEAIQAAPDSRAAYNQRGNVYQKMADKASIKGDDSKKLAKTAKAQSNTEDFNKYTAETNKYYDEANADYDLAIADFKQATTIDSTYAVGFYNIAICYFRKISNGDSVKAISFYKDAVENFSTAIQKSGSEKEITSYNSYKYRGLSYGYMGKSDLRKDDFGKYCAVKPSDAEICK